MEIKEQIMNLPTFHKENVAVELNKEWVEQPQFKSIVEDHTNDVICVVSNRYNLVQFKEILIPVVDGMKEEFEHDIIYHRGVCIMNIFPKSDEFKEDDKVYGLTVINSVDKSTGIIIKFNIKYGKHVLTFPNKLAAFVKTHSKKGFKITKDYINMITKVKEYWSHISEQLPNVEVNHDTLNDVGKMFGLSESNINYFHRKITIGAKVNVWNVVEQRLKEISYRNFKSDIHKQKALDKLCNEVYNYAVFSNI